MITSYMTIHHDEEYESQESSDRKRAVRIKHFAAIYDIPIRHKADGDTTYVEASLRLPSLLKTRGCTQDPAKLLEQGERNLWRWYARFLLSLENADLGYLLHEVDTETERFLLEGLLPTNDHYFSLGSVDVAYRPPTPARDASSESSYVILTGYFYGEGPTVAAAPEGACVLVVDYSRLRELPIADNEYEALTTAISEGNGPRAAELVDKFLRRSQRT